MNKLLWLDLETTGLDPNVHSIIEVSAFITNKELEIIDYFEYIINCDKMRWSQFAYKMHKESGLYDIAIKAPGSLQECELGLIEFVKPFSNNPKGLLMCGNSIHFDRKFIARYMPEFETHLHYRMFDVSGMAEMMTFFKDINIVRPKPVHRGTGDLQNSLEICRDLLKHIN